MNLVLQIVTLAVLFVGLGLKQKGKFAFHGSTMLVAVVLNAVSFFWVMWPAFLGYDYSVLNHPVKIVSLIHGVLGGVAEVLGVFLVVSWGVQRKVQSCIRRKTVMRVTIALWVIALILGIVLYGIITGIVVY
jgi:uncharacterized membrane protein YozB (DUF420 family)